MLKGLHFLSELQALLPNQFIRRAATLDLHEVPSFASVDHARTTDARHDDARDKRKYPTHSRMRRWRWLRNIGGAEWHYSARRLE